MLFILYRMWATSCVGSSPGSLIAPRDPAGPLPPYLPWVSSSGVLNLLCATKDKVSNIYPILTGESRLLVYEAVSTLLSPLTSMETPQVISYPFNSSLILRILRILLLGLGKNRRHITPGFFCNSLYLTFALEKTQIARY